MIIKANTDVQVPGAICYISNENVKLTGNDTVSIRTAYGSAAERETVNESTEMSETPETAENGGSFETDVYTYIIYK